MPFYRTKARRHIFVFAYDKVDNSLLHIYARHLAKPEDAIEVFFNHSESKWNEQLHRFETRGKCTVSFGIG